MGWKTNSVCGDLPIISKQKRVHVSDITLYHESTCWSHASGHWQPPKHVGQDFLKRKLPLLNQNMSVKIF